MLKIITIIQCGKEDKSEKENNLLLGILINFHPMFTKWIQVEMSELHIVS